MLDGRFLMVLVSSVHHERFATSQFGLGAFWNEGEAGVRWLKAVVLSHAQVYF